MLARINWSTECISFESLNEISVEEYLIRRGIISNKQRNDIRISEKDLIANRLRLKNIFIDNGMVICPKHRASFGIGWCDQNSLCHHPEHNPYQPPNPKDCRRANLIICQKIEGFPFGGK